MSLPACLTACALLIAAPAIAVTTDERGPVGRETTSPHHGEIE